MPLSSQTVSEQTSLESRDTVNVSSELITAIYAAFAQKESESISGNMRWSYQRRMESGTFLPSSMAYGYRLDGKKIVIDPEAALIVSRIFQWYLSGVNKTEIAKRLNEEGVPSGQQKQWYAAAVRYILTNEKYTGDSLWQKTYTSHTLPATRYKNTGEYEQFYAMGTHPPIISKEAFEQAQQLAQKRKSTYGKKLRREPYPLSQKISCGHCGSSYRRKEQVSSAYWCCRKHDTSVKDCPIAPVAEESLYGAFCRLYYKLKHQSIPILEQMLSLCMKLDAPLTQEEFQQILQKPEPWMLNHSQPLVRELYCKMKTQQLKPRVLVSYVREPYIFDAGNVRVTLDSCIRTSLFLKEFADGALPDISATDTPGDRILEVKYDAFLPEIIQCMLQTEELRQQAFSKYGTCRRFG